MVNDTTSALFTSPPTGALDQERAKLEAAYARAIAEYTVAEQTATAQAAVDDGKAYSQHDVPGFGRYVIPKRTGWQFLLDIIHDPVPNIDFSANIYPNFDGIIGQHFNNTRLLDPLDDHYESFEPLRDNIAAVRNFLMARYYAVDSTINGPKARQNLEEIAAFVGDGLYNNHYFGGIIPNHDPDKPHIDFGRAKEKGGAGAQYIYECILAHNRHSSGFRPFDAVIAMFGGKKAPDWKLPDAERTHFTEFLHRDLAPQSNGNPAIDAAIAAAATNLATIEGRLDAVRDAILLSNKANDLDNIGNHLLFTATHMEGVAHLEEPVRRRAVDIARDILKGLKIKLGDLDITAGLGLPPSQDMAVLGSIKGVAKVYERLLAWARNNGDSAIFQHPAVLAATQALAQMGYLAKQEALRMATIAGDAVTADNIRGQLALLPASFRPRAGARFGDLIDTIQSGMETILSRTQQVVVDGGQIGHALDGNMGGVNTIPTAGIANQSGVNNAADRNLQTAIAADLTAQAQAMRVNAQIDLQARKSSQTQPQAAPSRSSTGRQSLNTARAAKQQAATVSTGRVSPTATLTTAQQQATLRANTSASLAARRLSALGHHEDEHEEEALLRLQAQQRASAAKIKATALKLPPGIGFSTKGMTGAPIVAGRVPSPQDILNSRSKPGPGIVTQKVQTQSVDGARSHDHASLHHDEHPELPPIQPPASPTRGGGRGY